MSQRGDDRWIDRRAQYLSETGRDQELLSLLSEQKTAKKAPPPFPPSRRGFRLKPPSLKLAENDVESACTQLLAVKGYYVMRLHSGTFKSPDGRSWIKGNVKGTPDYVCLHGDYKRCPPFLLEVKRPGAKPTPEQLDRHSVLTKGFGLIVVVADSVESLARWLAQKGKPPPNG